MRIKIVLFVFGIMLGSCKQEANPKPLLKNNQNKTKKEAKAEIPEKEIRYSETELLAFMDSIAKLPSSVLQQNVAFQTDSIYKTKQDFNRQLSATEFKQLQLAVKSKLLDLKMAQKIFGKFPIDSNMVENGKYPISFFSFDKKESDLNEYAISPGYPIDMSENELFFFKKDWLLSKIMFRFRYDFELEHYQDSNNKTVVYYKENYASGTGIWWYNYYFYQYNDRQLIPILNEVQESNLQDIGWRTRWLKTKIVKTRPLTIKMVYYQQLYDTMDFYETPRIIDDSTFVKFYWDEKTKTLVGDYAHSKINKAEVLSYTLDDKSELLFINASYKKLKKGLLDPVQKKAILNYLNMVKNHFRSSN